jgi:Na+/H+-translocating membrane pyrophosphatase
MQEIAQHVREGAMAYLKQQYKVVAIVFAIITLIFAGSPTASICKTNGCPSPSSPAVCSPDSPVFSA